MKKGIFLWEQLSWPEPAEGQPRSYEFNEFNDLNDLNEFNDFNGFNHLPFTADTWHPTTESRLILIVDNPSSDLKVRSRLEAGEI